MGSHELFLQHFDISVQPQHQNRLGEPSFDGGAVDILQSTPPS